MKLEKILDNLNSLERNSFIKTVDSIIANGAKKHKQFPYRLLMKDVLIDEDRIIKAIKK